MENLYDSLAFENLFKAGEFKPKVGVRISAHLPLLIRLPSDCILKGQKRMRCLQKTAIGGKVMSELVGSI
jgi:hypothetical protein